jgi:cytochrome P450
VELEGHLIPKNSQVIPNLYAVHMSPDLWEAPEEFRPERFLSADGLRVQKPKHFMPFGAGQRMCLGDSLAEMELQLFFASLMHVFDLENPSSELPTMEGTLGATVTPKDFELNFVARNVEALIAANIRSKSSCWNQDVRIYG